MPTNSGVAEHAPPAGYIDALRAAMPSGMDVWNTSSNGPLTFT